MSKNPYLLDDFFIINISPIHGATFT